MRPRQSPAARRRWEEEGSEERRSRLRGVGVHRTEVTIEETGREDEDDDDDVAEGGGMGKEERSCIERESTMERELPEGNAMRPWALRSADPKLLRLGGDGSMKSHESGGCGACGIEANLGLGIDIVFVD